MATSVTQAHTAAAPRPVPPTTVSPHVLLKTLTDLVERLAHGSLFEHQYGNDKEGGKRPGRTGKACDDLSDKTDALICE